jgi:hypothetical protein
MDWFRDATSLSAACDSAGALCWSFAASRFARKVSPPSSRPKPVVQLAGNTSLFALADGLHVLLRAQPPGQFARPPDRALPDLALEAGLPGADMRQQPRADHEEAHPHAPVPELNSQG